ncbi:MAG: Helix-turn-helix domain [Acidobacteriaceae bacterium]|nr:Helix-turn-helix domain [Acidobacteriaceae bacterium]
MSDDLPVLASNPSKKDLSSLLDGYLRPDELAQALSRSRRTIDRYHRLGIGPPRVLIGGVVLYRIESLRAWLQAQEEQSNQPLHSRGRTRRGRNRIRAKT